MIASSLKKNNLSNCNSMIFLNKVRADLVNKIDFDNPASIVSYGSDVLENFSRLRDNLPLNFDDEVFRSYEFTDPIGKLDEFNKSLNGDESKNRQVIRQNRLANGICTMLNRISKGHIDLLHDNENYAEVYIDYLDNVQKVCEQIRKDKASLENDTRFFMKFKQYILMLQDNLDTLILAGNQEVENYRVKVTKMEKVEPTEAAIKKVLIDVAEERLMALRTTLEVMKGLCAQIDLKMAGSMRQKIKYDEYLQVTAPTLNIYASLAVGVKRDASRLERLTKVRDVANDTIRMASDKLADNMGNILELDKDSLISAETIESIVDSYKNGVKLLASSQAQKEKNRLQILDSFDQYDKIFEQYKETITRDLIGGDGFSSDSGVSKVKKIR